MKQVKSYSLLECRLVEILKRHARKSREVCRTSRLTVPWNSDMVREKIFSGVNTTTMQVEFIRVASSTSRIQSVGKSKHVMCSPVD